MKNWRTVWASKDFWTGVVFVAVAAVFLLTGRQYPMGTAMRMGPGYFPMLLGALLALIGLALMGRSFLKPGPGVGRLAYGKVGLVIGANLLFALLLRRLGLVPSLVLFVLVSAYASLRFRWGVALTLAAGLAAGCSIVFVWLLQLPLPLFGAWFGG